MRLRVVDIETTGIDPAEHGVCEIGWIDVVAHGRDLVDAPCDWRIEPMFSSYLTNPGRLIPPETSAVHHIVDEDVAAATEWRDAVETVLVAGSPDVLVAHSAKFERGYLEAVAGGRPWICSYKCALRLWPEAPSHSNQALRYWRRPAGLDRSIANVAHRAGPDAYVTAFHLRDMLELATVDQLIAWSSEPALQVRCHIGKWRGALWRDVDTGFLNWVSERDFDEDVLFTVRTELRRRRDEWEAEQRERADQAEAHDVAF